MLRSLAALAAALVLTAGAAFADPGIGGGIFGSPENPRVIEVCSTCATTVICGATCSSATSACAAGSAVAIAAQTASITNPITIKARPGVYNECVVIEMTDLSLVLDPGAIVKPTVAAVLDVTGGVLRIGPNNDGVTPTRIKIQGGTYHNNAFSGPESGCQIGAEGGTRAVGEITFDGVTCIGLHDGLQAAPLSSVTSQLTFRNVLSISGHDSCAFKNGDPDSTVIANGLTCLSWSNYCAPASGVNFTSCGTGNDTTHMCITSGPAADSLRGIELTLGTCAAAGAYTVTANTTSLLTFTPAAGVATDATCTINLTTVNDEDSLCTDDWITLNSPWKSAALHFANTANGSYTFANFTGRTIINSGLGGAAATGATASVISSISNSGAVVIDGLTGELQINIDSFNDDTPADSVIPVGGIIITSEPVNLSISNGFIKVRNTADPDMNIGGVKMGLVGGGTGALKLSRIVFDVDSTVGGYAATTRDLWFLDDALETLAVQDITSLRNGGTVQALWSTTATPVLTGNWCDHQYFVNLNPNEAADAFASFSSKEVVGGTSAQNATETSVDDTRTPKALWFRDLNVLVDVAPATTDSWDLTLMDDGVATAVTCQILGAATTCTYSGSPVLVAVGSKIDMRIDQTATPALAAEMLIGVCAAP